jgi:4-amino-4-deoxy-L-arabinose transferase-like glycosyltransferase
VTPSRTRLVLALLLALFAARLLHTAAEKSLTMDEPGYIGAGLYLWRSGDYHYSRVLQFHPPLTFHLASLPLLFLDTGDAASQPRVARALLERGEPSPEVLRLAGRLPFVLLACWGAALCFLFAREVAGDAAGLLAAFLFTFSPSFLAHGALAHSDITVSVLSLQALYALWRYERSPTALRLCGCGVALGLALAAKLSATVLVAAFGLELLRVAWRRGTPFEAPSRAARLARAAASLAALLALAIGVLWLAYGGSFAWSADPTGRFPELPLPGYLRSFLFVDRANALPRPYYFLGALHTGGDAAFMPLAFATKEPLGLLALVAAALLSLRHRRDRLSGFLAIPVALYLLILVVWLDVPLGYRYALPLLALICVFTATQLAPLAAGWPRRAALAACALLAVESLSIHPHYLAFFNAAAGGPAQGHRLFLDSNLDWGQDVPTLARELAARGNPPVQLALFAVEDPAHYGVRGTPLRGCAPAAGFVAISASVRMGLYAPRNYFARPKPDCYAWLDAFEPVARPGWSIFLYEIPGADGAAHSGASPR